MRSSYTVSDARDRGEIADHKNGVLRRLTFAQQRDRAGRVVVGVHPFEAGGVVVQHVHGRLTAVKPIQLLDPGLHSPMNLVLQYMPFQAGVMAPFANLSEFCSHEQEFLAGLGIHIAEQQAQVGELLPLISRHFADQRSFAVNDFVVRERQHEIFLKRIQHAEGEVVVVVLAMDGIVLEVAQCVVHPSHVPLHAEAEAAEINGLGNHGP